MLSKCLVKQVCNLNMSHFIKNQQRIPLNIENEKLVINPAKKRLFILEFLLFTHHKLKKCPRDLGYIDEEHHF